MFPRRTNGIKINKPLVLCQHERIPLEEKAVTAVGAVARPKGQDESRWLSDNPLAVSVSPCLQAHKDRIPAIESQLNEAGALSICHQELARSRLLGARVAAPPPSQSCTVL